ncbi:MAG: ABC transporter permease [Solirubrobacteraceae bacterium]|nr:ABC transporter permease [Solirubrobacteraceae bacterium]
MTAASHPASRRRGRSARGPRAEERRRAWFPLLIGLVTAVVLFFLVLPIIAIFVGTSPRELIASLGEPVVREALWLSAKTTMMALALILAAGTPAAYFLATRRFRGRSAVITLVELPLVLPPAVAGIGLLAAIGPSGILAPIGVSFSLSTAAVVVALTYVASPFYVRQAMASFGAVDRTVVDAARTLGASEAEAFVRVVIPTAMPGLVAGTALALGRALGEFGATIMFAGSFVGVTQTVPLAIYDRFSVQFPDALALSAVLVVVSAAILLSVKFVRGAEAVGGVGGARV